MKPRVVFGFCFVAIIFSFFLSLPAVAEEPAFKKSEHYKTKIPVTEVDKIALPKGYHEGLFFDGKNIWVNNGRDGNTWVIDTHSGEIISEIEPISNFTEGITLSEREASYWVTDWYEKKLFRVKIENNKMIEEESFSLEPAFPAGIVLAGTNLYVITWTRTSSETKYHLLEMDKTGRLLRKIRIKGIFGPAHLAWDGKHLWITSWYNQIVYKIASDTLEILGSFLSPAKDATGIVWDGTYLWLTGSYADLYKLSIEE